MQVKKAAFFSPFAIRTSQTWVRASDVQRAAQRRQHVARPPAANTFAFSSEVVKS